MPELPEVEKIARGLASRVTGDVIESVWLGSKPEPLKSPAAEIVATLESRRIAGVRRGGEHIVFGPGPARGGAGGEDHTVAAPWPRGGVGRAPPPPQGRPPTPKRQKKRKGGGGGAPRPT